MSESTSVTTGVRAAAPRTAAAAGGGVLLVANYESDVGYAWWLMENFWALIARAMQARGRRVVLAYPKVAVIPKVISEAPIEIVEKRIAARGIGAALQLGGFMRAQAITSVYLTDWPALHWVYLWWRLCGVRCIVVHDHTPGDRPAIAGARGLVKSMLHRLRILSATRYIGVAEHIRERHVVNWRVPRSKCFVVENGIVPFEHDASARETLRAELGIPANAIVVVMVSRANVYKGLDFAMHVLQRLKARGGPPLHFVHCGDGPHLEKLRTLASELGVAGQAHFLGRRSDVRALLSMSDIAFHPSRGEAMSLAILEFMCARLPVVLSDLPSVRTAVVDGETALVYAAENSEAAAAAIARLADDAALRGRLGAAGAARCLDRYTLARTNQVFETTAIPAL